MPWHTQANHPDCPPDRPWAVVKDDDGEVEGCHANEDDANDQVAALYANDEDEAAADPVLTAVYEAWQSAEANPTAEGAPGGEGESFDAAEWDGSRYSKGYWRGVLAVETVETGDSVRREFAEGALTWREPPLSIYWQDRTAPGHDDALIVARADEVVRSELALADGRRVPAILGRGQFDMESEEGRRVHRMIGQRYLRGISVTIDETQDADVDLIFPEGSGEAEHGEEGDMLIDLLVEPEKMLIRKGRVMDGCLTGQPALPEAEVELVPDDEYQTVEPVDVGGEPDVEVVGMLSSFSVVAPHEARTVAGTWNASGHAGRLPEKLDADVARAAYAWIDGGAIDDGVVDRSACKFLHHNVSMAGRPGAANLTACAAGIARLNGAHGGVDIPPDQREGVWGHLASHLRDGGQEPPELMAVEGAESFAAVTEAFEPPKGLVVVVRPADPGVVVVDGGLPEDELHVTLGYYGPADEAPPETVEALHEWAAERAEWSADARVGGVGRIGDDEPPATVYLIESAELGDLRRDLEAVAPPDSTHPHFTPHVTLGYGIDWPEAKPPSVALSGVELWVAGERFRGGESLTASMGPPVKPPVEWTRNPQLKGPTPPTYKANGRCWGHLAVWGVCHTSFMPKVCVTPPRQGDYAGFRTGTLHCKGGEEVAVGQITLGALHAPAALGFAPAVHHYEHAGHAVADVAVGEDDYGIWFAGALRPDTTDRQLRVLNASGVSGDWRKTRTGRWRLAGALVVNVPGFPVPRTQTHVRDGEQTSLVAAGVLVPPPSTPRNVVDFSNVVEGIARRVGLDHPSRRAATRARAEAAWSRIIKGPGGS